MAHRLQAGIAFEPGARPHPHFRLVLLNVDDGESPSTAHDALAEIWTMLAELARGEVRDLVGQLDSAAAATVEQFSGLTVLVGMGRRLFDANAHAPDLTLQARPSFLSYLAEGDGPFPALPWDPASTSNAGEADVVLQLTGECEAAVACAAVEIWKLIVDERLPLRITASYGGLGRRDGRGWLDFHDGVSNLEAGQRLAVLEAPADPAWMEGGTYMALLRLGIDLVYWRSLERDEQELLVGRDKLSGAPLIAVERDSEGRAHPIAGPLPEGPETPELLADWRDPPQTLDPLLEASHIHRANQNRGSAETEAGLRMFRQGYDFFEGFDDGAPTVGLNFVSFQRDLASFHHVLHLQRWLGDANFGGPTAGTPEDRASSTFVRVLAGGFYAVPPVAQPFPGSCLFEAGDR
jgi:deferrochelatase/peroxidase EfeB